MARNTSAAFRRAIYAAQTGEALVILLRLTHPTLANPIRVCQNGENLTSRGFEYQYFPFRVTIADEVEEAPREVRLEIDNVDRRIIETVRPLSGDLAMEIEVVLASQPDIVDVGPIYLALRGVEYDSLVVSGRLQAEDILNEPWPATSMTPSYYPGAFRGSPT